MECHQTPLIGGLDPVFGHGNLRILFAENAVDYVAKCAEAEARLDQDTIQLV